MNEISRFIGNSPYCSYLPHRVTSTIIELSALEFAFYIWYNYIE